MRALVFSFLIFFSLALKAPGANLSKAEAKASFAEEVISSKIADALSRILSKEDYLADVQVKTKEITVKENQNTAAQAPQTLDSEASAEDQLLFRKLGLEKPLEDAKPVQEPKETKEIVLSAAMANIYINKSLSEEVKEAAKSILNKLSFNLEIKPTIKVTDLEFARKKTPPPSLLEQATKFSTSIGFVAAALILSFVMLVIFILYSRLSKSSTEAVISAQKEAAAASAESSTSTTSASSQDSSSEVSGTGAGSLEGGVPGELDINLKNNSGSDPKLAVERFNNFYNKNKVTALSLIRKWIKLKAEGAPEALLLIAQELESNNLSQIFDELAGVERKEWKAAFSGLGAAADLGKGAAFIDEQILEEIIVPTDLVSEDTKKSLYSLNPDDCAGLITERPELGPLLFNTLASGFIVKVMPLLDEETTEKVLAGSVTSKPEKLKELDQELNKAINERIQKDDATPFSDKISQVLPFLDLSQEDLMFKACGRQGDKKKLSGILADFLPASAIPQLPEQTLKTLLERVPQQLMLQAIAVLEEGQSSKYLNTLAPEGGKKRELFDVELANIKNNEVNLARLQKNKDSIERDFVLMIRKTIKADPGLKEEIAPILDEISESYLTQSGETSAAA